MDKWLNRGFLARNNGYIVLNEDIERDLWQLGLRAPIRRIQHPIFDRFGDAPPRAEARDRLGIASDTPLLLFFGSVRPHKGLDILLESVAVARQRLPELRLIVATLVRSIPSMMHVVMLMAVIFYIYAVAGYHIFNEHDPVHWRSLGIALLTLFRIVTLEDWTDIMYAAMAEEPWAWLYFVSFVVLGTFVVINLFIAVVINNLEEAKQERLHDLTLPPNPEEILKELKATQDALTKVQAKLERFSAQGITERGGAA